MHCPQCDIGIGLKQIRYPRFKCLKCDCDLCVPASFQLKTLGLGVSIAFWGAYLIGLKGLILIISGVVCSFIIGAIIELIALLVAPPSIERYMPPGSLGLK
jgi:hypothetical protein